MEGLYYRGYRVVVWSRWADPKATISTFVWEWVIYKGASAYPVSESEMAAAYPSNVEAIIAARGAIDRLTGGSQPDADERMTAQEWCERFFGTIYRFAPDRKEGYGCAIVRSDGSGFIGLPINESGALVASIAWDLPTTLSKIMLGQHDATSEEEE